MLIEFPKYSLKFMKFINIKDAIIVSKRNTENVLESVQREEIKNVLESALGKETNNSL